MIASLAGPPLVGANFLGYLEDRLGVSGLHYLQEPSAITEGWETYIFRFQLHSRGGLPASFAGPGPANIFLHPWLAPPPA